MGDDMTLRGWASFLRAGSALGLLVVATAQANAGALAVHEQSAFGQGCFLRGRRGRRVAVHDVLESGSDDSIAGRPECVELFGFLPSQKILRPRAHMRGRLSCRHFQHRIRRRSFRPAICPTSSVRTSGSGMSLNSPFGLSVGFPESWAGRDYAAGNTSLRTYNAAPSIAYRINDWISVGAGVQIQYAKASPEPRRLALPFPGWSFPVSDANLSGTGWGYGFTAGVTLTPTPTTTIGLGYRSGIDQKIDGICRTSRTGALIGSVHHGRSAWRAVARHPAAPRSTNLTLLGTVEWTDWSRIGTSNIVVNGATGTTLPFQYKDGWLFSAGARVSSERTADLAHRLWLRDFADHRSGAYATHTGRRPVLGIGRCELRRSSRA